MRAQRGSTERDKYMYNPNKSLMIIQYKTGHIIILEMMTMESSVTTSCTVIESVLRNSTLPCGCLSCKICTDINVQQKYIHVVEVLCFCYVYLEPHANAQVTIIYVLHDQPCIEVVYLAIEHCMAQEFMHILLLKRILKAVIQIMTLM